MTPAEMLERSQWDTFWAPADATVVDRPELLLLSCPRPTVYLNTVIRVRAPHDALPGLLFEAEGHYRGRHTRCMVTDTRDPAPLRAALRGGGWTPTDRHEARVLPVSEWTRRTTVDVRPVDSMARLLDANRVANAAFSRPITWTDEELARDLRACTEGTRVHRFVAYDAGGTPIGAGGLTAFPELRFGLLWAGSTIPTARGKGAYTALLAARIERAKVLGLTTVGLYAKEHTSAPIVARMGFGRVGEMTYWEKDVPA